jgi:translation initiation factor IF-3
MRNKIVYNDKKDSAYPKANQQIKSEQVRLIDVNGDMLGIVSINEALKISKDRGLDLVEISPIADPPVCKILDYGKYKYEQKKKVHDARKKQKVVAIKEIKLRPNIGENDLKTKLKSIEKFINSGDKVKVTLKFRGREITHHELGMQVLEKIILDTAEIAKTETAPKLEGKQIMMVLVSNKV